MSIFNSPVRGSALAVVIAGLLFALPHAAFAQQANEDTAATKASPSVVQKNNAAVKDLTADDKVVEDRDGAKHPENGPAKPVERWMSACPPHTSGEKAADAQDCKKPGDGSSAAKPLRD